MQVIVQVSSDLAGALRHQTQPTAASEQISRIVKTYGRTLEPMHTNTDSLNLQSYFTIEVPDNATAQSIISHLQQATGIEAAYVKPPDELP
ncbi:hypothetical protein ACFLV5_01890 [Chloroflexota bacterium]